MMTVIERHLGRDNWTGTVDLQVLFFRLTLDSATEFLFGESVNSQIDLQTDITNSGKDDDSFAYAFDRAQYILAIAARLGNNYWLVHTPELHRMVVRVHKFVDYFVQKAMNEPSEKKTSDHYVFLHALAEQTQDPAELRSQLLNILLAGRDTTASLLGWFFHTMADKRYEHIYKRLRQIVVDEFGTYQNPREVTFERMKSCQYLQWCINEALRLYPVVPMNVRTALTDTTLPTGGGPDGRSPIFVPKGTDVGYSVCFFSSVLLTPDFLNQDIRLADPFACRYSSCTVAKTSGARTVRSSSPSAGNLESPAGITSPLTAALASALVNNSRSPRLDMSWSACSSALMLSMARVLVLSSTV
jgi:hypothetical protein